MAVTIASCVDLSGAAQGGDSADGGADASGSDDSGPPNDAATDGGGPIVRPSCSSPGPGISDCGPAKNEDCCASASVTGGLFLRGHDGVQNFDQMHPAQISDFALDRFEITVGRFRRFVDAVAGGWAPTA